MNRVRKIVFVLSLLTTVCANASSISLEAYNTLIKAPTHPDLKQKLICEREAFYIKKNPQECTKAAEMFLKSKKNLKAGYRFEFYGKSEDRLKVTMPNLFKQTDREFIDQSIADSYSYAAEIHNVLSQHEAEVKMYEKALEYKPNYSFIHFILGRAYFLGKGVGVNKIKSYKHWKIAAKQGFEGAQNGLDILCKESPWACK